MFREKVGDFFSGIGDTSPGSGACNSDCIRSRREIASAYDSSILSSEPSQLIALAIKVIVPSE